MNPGISQYEVGLDAWRNIIKKIDFIQLDLHEVKIFLFGKNNHNKNSLKEIIEQIEKEKFNFIITFNQYGSLGLFHLNNKFEKMYAEPFNIQEKVKDSTGSGDAFATGFVSSLMRTNKNEWNKTLIKNAMIIGRLWSAYACTTLGGSKDCPSKEDLDIFNNENEGDILKIIDIDKESVNFINELEERLNEIDK